MTSAHIEYVGGNWRIVTRQGATPALYATRERARIALRVSKQLCRALNLRQVGER